MVPRRSLKDSGYLGMLLSASAEHEGSMPRVFFVSDQQCARCAERIVCLGIHKNPQLHALRRPR